MMAGAMVMIESYQFGRVVIDGQVYTCDVIVYPERVEGGWWRKEGHKVHRADLEGRLPEGTEVLVVGTGAYGCMEVLPEAREFLEGRGVELVTAETGRACDLFNSLSSTRKTVAALHLTC